MVGPLFQGYGLPSSFCGTWLDSMCKVNINLQELQTFVLMLCRMEFNISGKVVALHLDNSPLKAYIV